MPLSDTAMKIILEQALGEAMGAAKWLVGSFDHYDYLMDEKYLHKFIQIVLEAKIEKLREL